MGRKIQIAKDYEGDWVGVWFDDRLVFEGHLYELDAAKMLNLLDIEAEVIEAKCVDYLCRTGRMPEKFEDTKNESL